MTVLRIRPARPTLALAVAIALSGCAAFDPNPGVLRGQPGTTAPAAGGAPAGTTPAKPAAKLSEVLRGAASIGTKAIANGQVRVFNAATSKSVPLLAAGGLNYNLKQVGATTDAKGQFNFQMPVPKVGDVFRVVVSDGKRSVTTLLAAIRGEDGTIGFSSLSSGAVAAEATSDSKGFSFAVTPATTLADASIRDLILLSQTLTDEAESKLLDEVLQKGQDFAQQVANNFTSGELTKIAEKVDPKAGQLASKELGDAMAKAGLERVFKQTVAESLQVLSELRSVASNVDTKVETAIDKKDLTVLNEAGFKVDLTGNSLSIEGNGLNIDFKVPTDVEAPVEQQLPTELPESNLLEDEQGLSTTSSPGKPFGTDTAAFNPGVKMSFASGMLTLEVSQGAGQEDVDTIVARIAKGATGASFSAPAVGQNIASGTSTALLANGTHTIEAVALTNAAAVAVSQRMGGGSLVNPSSVGIWKYNSTEIAKVQVFDRTSFVYVTLTYMLNDAVTRSTSTGGHTTVLNVPSTVLGLNAAKLSATESATTGSVDIDIFSREGNLLEVSDHIDAQ